MKCVDCDNSIKNENHKAWYAELTVAGKIMRCNYCGKKEEEKRWRNRYGDRPKPSSIEDLSIPDRIQHAKDLRNANLSPWQYKQE